MPWPQALKSYFKPLCLFFVFLCVDLEAYTDLIYEIMFINFLRQVELKQQYEVVLTTPMGLYRYRTGDVIKITGFYHQCPVYEFQHR